MYPINIEFLCQQYRGAIIYIIAYDFMVDGKYHIGTI